MAGSVLRWRKKVQNHSQAWSRWCNFQPSETSAGLWCSPGWRSSQWSESSLGGNKEGLFIVVVVVIFQINQWSDDSYCWCRELWPGSFQSQTLCCHHPACEAAHKHQTISLSPHLDNQKKKSFIFFVPHPPPLGPGSLSCRTLSGSWRGCGLSQWSRCRATLCSCASPGGTCPCCRRIPPPWSPAPGQSSPAHAPTKQLKAQLVTFVGNNRCCYARSLKW